MRIGEIRKFCKLQDEGQSLMPTAMSQLNLSELWNTRTGELLLTLAGHSGEVIVVGFSPNGSRVATSRRDGTARSWDVTTGRNLLTLEAGGGGGLTGVAFDATGTRLATGGERGVRIFALRIEDLIAWREFE